MRSNRSARRAPYARTASLLILLLVSALLAAACGSDNPQPARTPEGGTAGPTTASPIADGSSSPCRTPLSQVGSMTRQLAEALVPLRLLVLDPAFDAGETLAAIRRVSAVMTNYVDIEASLAGCADAEALTPRLTKLIETANTAMEDSLSGLITDAATQRDAGARLVALLPEVLALSETATEAATAVGIEMAAATVPEGAEEPIGNLPPLPTTTPEFTPQPTPKPPARGAVAIAASYFGARATVDAYRVRGSTPAEILRSINANGPYLKWIDSTATGLTRTRIVPRLHFASVGFGSCQIVPDANPPIQATFTVELPRWDPPSKATKATIKWWNREINGIAEHEKTHVDIYRSAVRKMNDSVGSSTCQNLQKHIDAIAADAERQQCEFDIREYGEALGLTVEACLNR
jgi:predicted secreted Zn-dependent protease